MTKEELIKEVHDNWGNKRVGDWRNPENVERMNRCCSALEALIYEHGMSELDILEAVAKLDEAQQ